MTRRTRSLTLFAAALILFSLGVPALAQAAPAPAKAPVQMAPAKTLAPAAAPGAALPLFLQTEGATDCSTVSSVLGPETGIFLCPNCPPGWTVCGPFPRCGCCRGDL